MKDEEFKEKLSRVAEWTVPEINGAGNAKPTARRGRKTKEEQYQEAHQEAFIELFNGVNPTVQPVVINVKVQGCMCEDCGRFCENGRKTEKTKYNSNRPHWRERCVTCGMNQNPNTGAWDLSNKDASGVWAVWLRKTSEKPYAYKKVIRIKPENKECDK